MILFIFLLPDIKNVLLNKTEHKLLYLLLERAPSSNYYLHFDAKFLMSASLGSAPHLRSFEKQYLKRVLIWELHKKFYRPAGLPCSANFLLQIVVFYNKGVKKET